MSMKYWGQEILATKCGMWHKFPSGDTSCLLRIEVLDFRRCWFWHLLSRIEICPQPLILFCCFLYFFNSGMSATEFTRDTNWRNNFSWLSRAITTAFSGQTSAHLPHPLQSSVIDAFPFFISMAFTKQALMHIPQPLQMKASAENERPGRRL